MVTTHKPWSNLKLNAPSPSLTFLPTICNKPLYKLCNNSSLPHDKDANCKPNTVIKFQQESMVVMRLQCLLARFSLVLPLITATVLYEIWQPIKNTSDPYVIQIGEFIFSEDNKKLKKNYLIFQSVEGGEMTFLSDTFFKLIIKAKDESSPTLQANYLAAVWDQPFSSWNFTAYVVNFKTT